MYNLNLNDRVERLELESIQGSVETIPHESHFTHMQFRRFAGCPMCNLHIQDFIKHHQKLLACGVQEVVVFHSTKAALLSNHVNAPFPIIADPEKVLYRQFNVEASLMAILHPRAWLAGIKGLFARRVGLPGWGESVVGLPADFLIDRFGKIVAMKYGKHAYDHWELDEVIDLTRISPNAMGACAIIENET